jgi:hypothetical protein
MQALFLFPPPPTLGGKLMEETLCKAKTSRRPISSTSVEPARRFRSLKNSTIASTERPRIRNKEQNHHRCMCPYRFIWKCDGDCIGCEYHAAGDTLSLDVPNPDGNSNMYDYLPDNNTPIEELISDRILLEQLFARLRELDPEADTIIQLWMDHPEGISDRAIARELGRPQKTFADQMKKYRTDLRKIRDGK